MFLGLYPDMCQGRIIQINDSNELTIYNTVYSRPNYDLSQEFEVDRFWISFKQYILGPNGKSVFVDLLQIPGVLALGFILYDDNRDPSDDITNIEELNDEPIHEYDVIDINIICDTRMWDLNMFPYGG